MTSVAKDLTPVRHQSPDTNHKILMLQITGYKYFLSYSFNYLSLYSSNYLSENIHSIIRVRILLIISYFIIIHPVICNIRILWLVPGDWCRTGVRPARLVSYAFLYTTHVACLKTTVSPLRDNKMVELFPPKSTFWSYHRASGKIKKADQESFEILED